MLRLNPTASRVTVSLLGPRAKPTDANKRVKHKVYSGYGKMLQKSALIRRLHGWSFSTEILPRVFVLSDIKEDIFGLRMGGARFH